MRLRSTALLLLFAQACGSDSGVGGAADAGSDARAPDAPQSLPDAPPDIPQDVAHADGYDATTADDANVPDAGSSDSAPADVGLPDLSAVCGDLRLWFRFEETAGATVDWSGCGNHGTPSAVTRGQPGRVGDAYRFNDASVSTAHVLVPDAPSLSDLGMLTVEAWVRHTGGILEAVVAHGDGNGGDPFIFHTFTARDPAVTLGFYPTCDGLGSAAGAVPMPLDAWTHIAATVNNTSGEVFFYQDGILSGTGTGYMNMGHMCDNAEPMIVGGLNTVGLWGWDGWIDELRVWAVLRTQAEVCTDAGGTPNGGGCVLPP